MWFLIVIAVLLIAAYFLWPTPAVPSSDAGKASLDDFSFPTNSNGRVIPEVFGTCHLYGNIIWAGDLTAVPITQTTDMGKRGSRTDIVGYSYFLGLAYAIAGPVDSMTEFRVDNKTIATFTLTGTGTFSAKTGKNAEIYGSTYGNSTVRAYLGAQTVADSYIATKTGYNIAYKNMTYLVFQSAFVGDNVRACPQYSVIVKRTNLNSGWVHYDIGGDANPAHVLYYVMYNMLKIPATMLDITAFQACGETLYTEALGMSFIMSSAQEAQNWIKEILRHIDGVIYYDPLQSKFTLKLIREDYTLATCPELTASNTKKVQFSRKGWEDTISLITVKYTDRATFKENTITQVNSAARINLGYVRSESLNFMCLSNSSAAQQVMNRLIKKQSYPLATLKFAVSTKQFQPMPGDVYNFNNANMTPAVSDMAIRIMNVTGNKEDEQEVNVEALEDIFGIGSMQLRNTQGNISVNWDYDIKTFPHYAVKDARQEMLIAAGILPLFVVPSGLVVGTKLFLGGDYKTNLDAFGYATLSGTLVVSSTELDDVTTFTVQNPHDIEALALSREQFQKCTRALIIDDEIIFYQNCTYLGGNAYRISNLMRGQVGTTNINHAANAPVWFGKVDSFNIKTALIDTPTVSGDLLAYNGFDSTNQPFAYTYQNTVETPYPPSNVSGYHVGTMVHLQWQPCIRRGGANYRAIDSFPANDETPEGTWEVNNYGAGTWTTTSGGIDIAAGAPAANYRVRSVLAGLTSAWVGPYNV